MEIKHSFSFKIRTYGLKGGKYQIRLRISFNGFRHDVVTGCVLLDRNAWDEKAELVKDGYVGLHGETAASMNSRLRMLRDQMKNNRVLPQHTNQAMNRELKQLCRMAGMEEPIRISTYKGSEMSKMNFLD